MTDASRPQPEYGQYASPEEVARARGLSLGEHQAQLEAARAAAARPIAGAGPEPIGADAQRADTNHTGGAPHGRTPAPGSPWAPQPKKNVTPAADARFARNRVATIALLALGFVSLVLTMPALFSFGDSMRLAFQQQGLNTYSSHELADTLGFVGILGQVALWVLALAASVAQLRRRRSAWWIPLIAGVLAVLLVSAVMIAAITADPAFVEYVQSMSPGTPFPG